MKKISVKVSLLILEFLQYFPSALCRMFFLSRIRKCEATVESEAVWLHFLEALAAAIALNTVILLMKSVAGIMGYHGLAVEAIRGETSNPIERKRRRHEMFLLFLGILQVIEGVVLIPIIVAAPTLFRENAVFVLHGIL